MSLDKWVGAVFPSVESTDSRSQKHTLGVVLPSKGWKV